MIKRKQNVQNRNSNVINRNTNEQNVFYEIEIEGDVKESCHGEIKRDQT